MAPTTDIHLYTGALNQVFDQGEGFIAKGFDSLQRIGQGIQSGLNKLAGGVLGGIKRADEENRNTLNEAIVSE